MAATSPIMLFEEVRSNVLQARPLREEEQGNRRLMAVRRRELIQLRESVKATSSSPLACAARWLIRKAQGRLDGLTTWTTPDDVERAIEPHDVAIPGPAREISLGRLVQLWGLRCAAGFSRHEPPLARVRDP